MAKGAAATARSYRGRNTIARTAKPRTNRVTTQNAGLRIAGEVDYKRVGVLNHRLG